MSDFPERHRNHEIETLSENYFRNQIPLSWVLNKFTLDYGVDYNCEIVIDKMVSGMNFSVQLKGKEKEENKEFVKIKIKRTTINRWLKKLEPTMIIAYIIEENEAYWMWFENNTVDLTLDQQTFTINIPKKNKLSDNNWENCKDYIENIFKRRNSLYEVPDVYDIKKEAWKFYIENNYKKALPLFYDILNENPENGMILEIISLCEYKLFNYQKALILINKALDISNNKSYLLNKASILTEQGNINNDNFKIREAIEIYQNLISENYISDTLYYNLGSALGRIEEYESSINYFKLAIILNPNKPEIWNNLGNSYMQLGLHDLEIDCYNKALKINPNQVETLFSKGSSLFRYFGFANESLTLMLKASELTDRYEYDNPNFFFWMSQIYIARNEIQKAKDWNTKGLKHFSSNKFLLEQSENIKNKNVS